MKNVLLFTVLFFQFGLSYAQRVHVNGRVTDEDGFALPGATVQIKGTPTTSVTDHNGLFRMYAEPEQLLEIRFMGFLPHTLQAPADEKLVEIILREDATMLNEVVVTGALGIKRAAREMGASAQVIENENLNQGKPVNPILGLSSKVAGLRINMYDSKVDPDVQVILRGTRSLQRTSGIDGRNPNAPIYVVDGVPIPNISRLNPNDIESITVLKGANAAALYGSEGVNGALMITTKTGKKGAGTVRVSNTTMFSQVYMLPEAQTQYGQGMNGIYSPTTFESWGPAFDGSMRDFGAPLPDGTQPQLRFAAPERDNRLGLFQTGVNTQNDISFSGGDDNSTYFMSAQHVHQQGIIPEDVNNRLGLRFNGTRRFGKLHTSYNVNYINNKNDVTPDGPWIGAYRYPANFDFDMVKEWQNPNAPGNPNNYFIPNGSWLRNPYFLIDNIRNVSEEQILNFKVDFNYQLSEKVNVIYRLGHYTSNTNGRNTVNKFQAEGTRNTNGSVNDFTNHYSRWNGDLILQYRENFGDFSLQALAGQNFRTDYRKDHNLAANNLLYSDIFNQSSRVGELAGGSSIMEQRALAVYGEAVFGYKDYLYLNLTGRNDWVSVLSPQNRSYFYPGVSTSFIASDAWSLLKHSSQISYTKFYASWNQTGNVTLNPYQLNNPYSQNNGFPFGNSIGFLPGLANPNPNIMPEFVTSYEAGLNVGLFKHRVYLDATYVFSDADGQISNANVSRATGYNSMLVNAGRMTSEVLGFSIQGDVIRTLNSRWNLGANYTHTKNIVRELYGDAQFRQNFRQSYAIVGEAFPSLWLSDYERDPQGRVVVDADSGDPIVATDNALLGTLVPPHMIGINSLVEYKGFSFGLQFDWRMGGWFYSETVPPMYEHGTHPETARYGREPFIWPNSVVATEGGGFVENDYLLTSGGGKEFWSRQGAVQSNTAARGDFFKLRELNIAYALPSSLLGRQKAIKEASIAFVANNLFIITHSSNKIGDPEYLYNNTDGYYSFRQVPPMRNFGFNVNLQF
ncbi:SusC/RagA family TonB-linked outer membrane protein [Litoribacter ruber]|uniref:SusC/RagA family TonB-linked outer membrane protein n=1 Tax=Litoribacter ruber TaxID=702568 RepID=UPI001BD9BC0B|nr:SusC/RagA family TonB-linked outer membrane protein [Litoribacter ruber]MBT0811595.1 SusC/RagA family TonB-linked outer membrane protein [Litoribacter ruber]